MSSPTELRKGRVINFEGKPYLVTSTDFRTPGRRPSFMQAGLKCLLDGNNREYKFMNSESVTFMDTDTKPMEFSYVDEMGFHFGDPETFEDFIIPVKMVEDLKKFMVEGQTYNVLFVENKAVRVELPASVEMLVKEAPDAVRGDTSSSPSKTIVMETGLAVQAPLFIKAGEKLRVSTEDGSYLGRA
jgi:elongation factor P